MPSSAIWATGHAVKVCAKTTLNKVMYIPLMVSLYLDVLKLDDEVRYAADMVYEPL